MRKPILINLLVLASSLSPNDIQSFVMRRMEVKNQLGPRSAMVLFTANTYRRNGDVNHEFRPDSDFWYLTGHPEPDARLILTPYDFPGRPEVDLEDEIILAQPRDPRWEMWNGKRLGAAGARETLGFRHFAVTDSFEIVLAQILPHIDTLYVNNGGLQMIPERIKVLDAGMIVHPLRHIKSEREIGILQMAIDITGEGIVAAMMTARPGLYEYNIQATIEFGFRNMGSKRLGFPSIVGSGPNSTIIHHTKNERLMKKGDLLLIDVGAEHQMYTADITRTIPVSGKFTPEQAELYGYVLTAQKMAFDSARVGMSLRDLQRIAKSYLRNKGFDQYFVHGIGHWLGLDVHDVGGRSAEIEVGSVFTIEPGIYVPEDDLSLPEEYRGTGIRIEDDVLMTENGPVWLSAHIPREIDEIETLMRKGRRRFRERR